MERKMAGTVNRAILVARLGADPKTTTFQDGGKAVRFSAATSDTWNDAQGQRQEKTVWHQVVIFNEHLAGFAESYLKKGALVYIEGQINNRSYEQDGQTKYTSEIELRFNSALTLLDTPAAADRPSDQPRQRRDRGQEPAGRS
jgi:single-strand DNA-binding protein